MVADVADTFADIRPYENSEVPGVIRRLERDGDFADAMARLYFGRFYRVAPTLARRIAGFWLALKLRSIDSIDAFQHLVAPLLDRQIQRTARYSHSGLLGLDQRTSWLFVSNHRDIAMDPALANHAIYHAGYRTLSVAIGDNLLREPWVADLMRLNKCFIVKRGLTGPRELLAASKHLSRFIRWMISGNHSSIWIAQREGRAKDGCDSTEAAVVKMLALSRDKSAETLSDVLNGLRIVPLAISYELDPCDALKAAELAAGAGYIKAANEDVQSIARGITGQKGAVHLAFGKPIAGDDLTIESVVEAIDRQITTHYRLYSTHLWAWQRLEQTDAEPALAIYPGTVTRDAFEARIDALPEDHRHIALEIYANPLRRALQAQALAS